MSATLDYELHGNSLTTVGRLILYFGVAFNAMAGWTLGFGALALATATIVMLFDIAKMALTKAGVIKYKTGEFAYFVWMWVIILTALSIGTATMFYSQNMNNVAKFAHENSSEVQAAKQTLELTSAQAKQFEGFAPLAAQTKVGELDQQMAAILAKPATNSSGRGAGNIGGRTGNCSGSSSYYATKYANDCAEYSRLKAERNSLASQIGMATTANSSALSSANNALATMGDFNIGEGIPGFAVLGRMFYPNLPEKEAAAKVFAQANIIVAFITELLGTSLLIIGYGMQQVTSGGKPTGTGARITSSEQPQQPNPMPAGAAALHRSGMPSPLAKATDSVLNLFGEKAAPEPSHRALTQAERNANGEKWRKALEDRGVPVPDIDKAMEQDASDDTINNILGELDPIDGNKRLRDFLYNTIRQQVISQERRPTVRPVTNAVTDLVKENAADFGVPLSLFSKPRRQKIAETIIMRLANEGVIQRNTEAGIGLPKHVLSDRYQSKPPADPVHKVDTGSQQGKKSQSPQGKTISANLYHQWKAAVYAGKIKPTTTDSRAWLIKETAASQQVEKTPTLTQINNTLKGYFARACRDPNCRIRLRPDYKNGQRNKYILDMRSDPL